MVMLFILLIVVLLGYLIYDYINSSKNQRMLDRLEFGFDNPDEEVPSLWAGATDLLQLESLRDLMERSAITRSLDIMIRRAQLKISTIQALLLLFCLSIIAALVAYYYARNIYAPLGALFLTPFVIWRFWRFLSERQQKRLDLQLAPLINSLLTTMRAGGTPTQALQATSRNAVNPMRDSITHVLNQLQIGHSPNVVWKDWADFWDTKSSRLLATGIRVKWETGGQMTTVLEHILESIEFHKRVEQRINTLTTQAKLGSWVLSIIPPALVYLQYKTDASLVTGMIDDNIGQKLYIYAGISTLVGFFWLRKIAKVKTP